MGRAGFWPRAAVSLVVLSARRSGGPAFDTGRGARLTWRPSLVLGATLALGLALLAAPATALAHANLARSDPASNADLAAAPVRVQLWFTERPEVTLTTVQVYDA